MAKVFFKKLTIKEKKDISAGSAIDPFKPNKECYYGTPDRKGTCDQVIHDTSATPKP